MYQIFIDSVKNLCNSFSCYPWYPVDVAAAGSLPT